MMNHRYTQFTEPRARFLNRLSAGEKVWLGCFEASLLVGLYGAMIFYRL